MAQNGVRMQCQSSVFICANTRAAQTPFARFIRVIANHPSPRRGDLPDRPKCCEYTSCDVGPNKMTRLIPVQFY